jgi:polar amino acid transport system substrate-binding protein
MSADPPGAFKKGGNPMMVTRSIGLAFCAALALMLGASNRVSAQNTLSEIKSRGKAIVATEAAYAPFEFLQDGKIVGYDEDVLNGVVKGWNVQLEQQDVPFAGILAGLLEKKYDFVATALLINPERAGKYAFTMPVAAAKIGIMRQKNGSKLKSIDDLTGLTIGSPVPPAGPTTAFQHYNDELKAKGKGAAKNVFFQSAPELYLALANGQIDGAADSILTLTEGMKKNPGAFEIAGTFGEPFFIGWVTRPEDTSLRDAINVEIKKMRDSGQLKQWQEKWFGVSMEIPDSGYLPAGAK